MPSIEVSLKDLEKLVGKKLEKEKLADVLANVKCELEGVKDDTLYISTVFDRPDTLSAEGIARALKAYFEIELGLKQYELKKSGIVVKVDKSVFNVRPVIKCGLIKNRLLTDDCVKQLMQLQEKIHLTYARKRAKASIGIYDFDKTTPPYTYKAVEPDKIRFVPLEETTEMNGKEILTKNKKGIEYAFLLEKFDKYPLLIDSKNTVLSMPPIINSENTKISPETKNLFIDVTGPDERIVNEVLITVATILAERGAQIQTVDIVSSDKTKTTPELKYDEIIVDPDFVNKWLGSNFKPTEMKKFLEKERFDCSIEKNKLRVRIPCYRFDVMHPVDIAEEIAIGYGVNNFKLTLPNISTIGELHPLEKYSNKLRELMIGLSFQEVSTFILSNKELFKKFKSKEVLELKNPVSEEYCVLRNSLTPKLLEFLAANKHRELPQRIFEVDDIVESNAKTIRKLGAAIASTNTGFTEMKSAVEALFRVLGKKIELKEIKDENFITGRIAEIHVNGKKLGVLGEIHPAVLNSFELENPVSAFEIVVE